MTRTELVEHTNKDEKLQIIKKQLNDSIEVNNEQLEQIDVNFRKVFNELMATADGLILRGESIVLPDSLQARAVSIAHEGHQGLTRVKGF